MKKNHRTGSQKNIKRPPLKVLLLFAALFVSLGAFGLASVYASLKDSDQVTNSLRLSDLTGTIEENFEPPTLTNPAKPGSSHTKKVTVKNQSTAPFFVRVLVTPEIQSKEGLLLASTIGKELLIDIQPEWILGEDGYYYYLGKVAATKETTPLFRKVTISSTLDATYKEASLNIQIKSETVSSAKYLYQQAWWNNRTLTEKNLVTIDQTLKGLAD